MDLSLTVLLEFLYNKFAFTLGMCAVGSLMRSIYETGKKDKKIAFNIKGIIVSTLFSTFLMCACSVYIDLAIEIYILLCVLCGIWGLALMKLVMDENFMVKLLANIGKKVADPIIKGTMETISDASKKEDDKDKSDEEDKKE